MRWIFKRELSMMEQLEIIEGSASQKQVHRSAHAANKRSALGFTKLS
jgi:hypothetical protein